MNYGLINKPYNSTDDWFKGVSRSNNVIVNEAGDWTDFLPPVEYQSGFGFDSFSCVSFSALNCLETLLKAQGIFFNASDRWLAKMSGTTGAGNTVWAVADAIRKCGLVTEQDWPYDRATMNSWDTFYSDIPKEIQDLGKKFLEMYEVNYENVRYADIKEALKYAPLQVGVYAWLSPVNGIYPCDHDKSQNHLVELFKIDADGYYYIYDHYNQSIKKLDKGFKFGSVVRYSIKPNQKPMLQLENNTLVQEVTESGKFGLYLDGKIFVDDTALILATWTMRNTGMGLKKAITKEDWDSVLHYNLKREQVD